MSRNAQVEFYPVLPEADLDSLNKNTMDGQNFYGAPPMTAVREVFLKNLQNLGSRTECYCTVLDSPQGGAPIGKPFPKSAERVPPSVEVSISFRDDEAVPTPLLVSPQIWRGV